MMTSFSGQFFANSLGNLTGTSFSYILNILGWDESHLRSYYFPLASMEWDKEGSSSEDACTGEVYT